MEIINIDCNEIIQWLESRRKLGGGWPETYKGYQLKLKQLLDYVKTLGYEEVTEFVEKKEKDFSYIDLTQLFEMLEDTEEAKKRTFFNSYAARSLKDSKGLIKILERGNLHLVDIGKKINHALSFEKVALNKRIKNNEKAINESLNRIRMNKAAVGRNEDDKVEYLKKLDLDEENLHTKISDLVYKLPEKIKAIVDMVQHKKAKGYLDFFYEFSLCMNPSLKEENIRCKVIEYLRKHGDVASKDFNTGNASPKNFDYNSFFQKRGYYDLSGNAKTGGVEEISEVNWDMEIQESGTTGTGGIDWEISEVNDHSFEIIGETSLDDNASILTSKTLRIEVLAELNEILLFYQIKAEASDDDILGLYDKEIKTINKKLSRKERHQAVKFFSGIINLLNEEKLRKTFGLIESEKTKERLVKVIQNHNRIIEKKQKHSLKCKESIEVMQKEVKQAKKDIQKINKRVKKLGKVFENKLGKLISRKIALTGLGA